MSDHTSGKREGKPSQKNVAFGLAEPAFDKVKPPLQKFMTLFCRILLCVSIVFFAVYAVLVISNTGEYAESFFARSAYITFDRDIQAAEAMIDKHYERLYGLAAKLEYADSQEKIQAELTEEYRNILYLSGDAAYNVVGERFGEDQLGYTEIMALAAKGAPGCSDVYYNTAKTTEYVAFFVPVRGSLYVDGIVSRIELHDIVNAASIRAEDTQALILMDPSGVVFSEDTIDGFAYTTGENLRSFLRALTPDERIYDEVGQAIKENRRASFPVQSKEKGYTISIAPVDALEGRLWLATLVEHNGALSPELTYIRHVVNVCAMLIVGLAIAILYLIHYFNKKRATEGVRSLDTPDGCPGKDVFRINAAKLLQNRGREYALAVLEIRQFRYIRENSTEKEIAELLQYIAKVIGALCNVRESYGYLDDGRFGLLIYIDSKQSVKDRVRLIESVAGKNALLGAGKSKRKFNIGISMTQESAKQTFPELLGYAEIACEKAKNNINVPYVIFNEQINSEQKQNEQIEAEMETALANGEFRLFLQPKYNVLADRIDSAEALVRWFDTKRGDYRFPGEFIGLFESNGFIIKLDHFMYLETLKYLSAAAERFDKVVPISVNVSMVTVSDPGFLDFYVENKKKYKIGDGFIVIEFTESFAMEDYQKIRTIVDTLHQNGIVCSLDDFGSGYSSLGTLKNIPFDELKFDRLFLERGCSKENDDRMLQTLFSLAKSMGIRVVQEGVETKEMFDLVVAGGCDVVQGYYYAKAIPVEEYKLFINSNTSIKYKSRVK